MLIFATKKQNLKNLKIDINSFLYQITFNFFLTYLNGLTCFTRTGPSLGLSLRCGSGRISAIQLL